MGGTMKRSGRVSVRSLVVGSLVVGLLIATPRGARAEAEYANDFGIGFGTVVVNLLYMPVKVVYGTLGAITGGFAYVLTGGNLKAATAVWRPSMGGTYVVTPSMLQGEDRIYFSGSAPDSGDKGADERSRGKASDSKGY